MNKKYVAGYERGVKGRGRGGNKKRTWANVSSALRGCVPCDVAPDASATIEWDPRIEQRLKERRRELITRYRGKGYILACKQRSIMEQHMAAIA